MAPVTLTAIAVILSAAKDLHLYVIKEILRVLRGVCPER